MSFHADERGRVDTTSAWAASGAMALTGPPGGPGLGPPERLVAGLARVGGRIASSSGRMGRAVTVDPLALLGERAAIGNLHRQGSVSCGGAARLLPTADGWVAVSLARPSDVDLLPAWFHRDVDRSADPWELVATEVRRATTGVLVANGAELGLPVGGLPTGREGDGPSCPPVRLERFRSAPATTSVENLVVVDLASLWAGPLCGSLLQLAGAEVWKVESTNRPDGARLGPPAFFDLMNAGKRSLACDFATSAGRNRLRAVIEHADVVIEASRPRALEQLGIDARRLLSDGRLRAWVSITGHGRRPPGGDRIGFGDDAAVAGGLVSWDDARPHFCADAIADPLSGMVAAASCLEMLAERGSWLLDVSMAAVAADHAGPTLPVPAGVHARAPRARVPIGTGPELGADTATVLASIEGAR